MKELWGNLSANTIYNELKDSQMTSDEISKHIPIYLKFNKEEGIEGNILANTLCIMSSNGLIVHETLHGYIVSGSIYNFMKCVCANMIHSPYTINIISEIRKYGKILADTKFVNELSIIDRRSLVNYQYNENIEMYVNNGIMVLNDSFKYVTMIKSKYNVNENIFNRAYITFCASLKDIDIAKMCNNGISISRINKRDIESEIHDIIKLASNDIWSEDNHGHDDKSRIEEVLDKLPNDIINVIPYDESNYLITDTVENILNYDIDTTYIIELKNYIKNKLESEHDTSTIYAYENKYKSDEDLTSWKKAYGEDADIDDEDLIQKEIQEFDPNYKYEE
ncbi:MAG: hypothetical protein ACRCXT_12270 [Paraclostridium sp.]